VNPKKSIKEEKGKKFKKEIRGNKIKLLSHFSSKKCVC